MSWDRELFESQLSINKLMFNEETRWPISVWEWRLDYYWMQISLSWRNPLTLMQSCWLNWGKKRQKIIICGLLMHRSVCNHTQHESKAKKTLNKLICHAQLKWKSLSKRSFSFSLNQTWKSLLSWKKESWSKWGIRSEAQRTQGTQAKCCGALWRWCDGTGPVRREEEECGLRWLLGQWTCSSPIKHEGLITAFWPHCTGFVLGTSPLTSRWHETGCQLTICREFDGINYICLYYHQ